MANSVRNPGANPWNRFSPVGAPVGATVISQGCEPLESWSRERLFQPRRGDSACHPSRAVLSRRDFGSTTGGSLGVALRIRNNERK